MLEGFQKVDLLGESDRSDKILPRLLTNTKMVCWDVGTM